MSRPNGQDAEELLRQTIARVQQLAPVLKWPRVAYQAKLNPYGSFYATFYDTASNRRVENGQAGPSTTQPGSVSPAAGEGSPTVEQQSQPASQAQEPRSAGAASPTSAAPQQPHQQQQPRSNGDAARACSAGAGQPSPAQQQQQQQRKGPRGFNIPRPNPRARPATQPSGGSAIAGGEGGPSPSNYQAAHSPDKHQHQQYQPQHLQRYAGAQRKFPATAPQRPSRPAHSPDSTAYAAGAGADASLPDRSQGEERGPGTSRRGSVTAVGRGATGQGPRACSGEDGDSAVVVDIRTAEPQSCLAEGATDTGELMTRRSSGARRGVPSGPSPRQLQDGPAASPGGSQLGDRPASAGAGGDTDVAAAKATSPGPVSEEVNELSGPSGSQAPIGRCGGLSPRADAAAPSALPSSQAVTPGADDAATHMASLQPRVGAVAAAGSLPLQQGPREAVGPSGSGTAAEPGGDAAPSAPGHVASAADEMVGMGAAGAPRGDGASAQAQLHPHGGGPGTDGGIIDAYEAADDALGATRRSDNAEAPSTEPDAAAAESNAAAGGADGDAAAAVAPSVIAADTRAVDDDGDIEIMLMEAFGGWEDADGETAAQPAPAEAAVAPAAETPAPMAWAAFTAAGLSLPSCEPGAGDASRGDGGGDGLAPGLELGGDKAKACDDGDPGTLDGTLSGVVMANVVMGPGSAPVWHPCSDPDVWEHIAGEAAAGQEEPATTEAEAAGQAEPATTEAEAARAAQAPPGAVDGGSAGDAGAKPPQALPHSVEVQDGAAAVEAADGTRAEGEGGDSPAASPPGQVCAAGATGAQAEAVQSAVAAKEQRQAMLPPPAQPQGAPQLQQRLEGETAMAAGRTPAGISVSRRTSNISLQTLESGELPCLDTPVGGTPSSALQPLPLHREAAAGGAAVLPRASRSSSLGSLLLMQQLSGRANSLLAGRNRLDMAHAESGELPTTLSEVQPLAAAVPAGKEAAAAAAPPGSGEPQGAVEAEAEEGTLPDGTSVRPGAADGQGSPGREGSARTSQDGGRRRRWGAPMQGAPEATAAVATGGSGDGDSAAAPDAVAARGSSGGGADTADVAQAVSAVNLSMAKGLAAHLSTHGSLQAVVPGIQAMNSAGSEYFHHTAPRSGLKRHSRSPSRSGPDRDLERERGRRGSMEREPRGSRERPAGPSASAAGGAEVPASGEAGAGVARRARSRSRSRERPQRHSRSPRRRTSRSRSRSPMRDWRGKRDRGRASDYDRCRDRDRDRDRDRYGGRERERERDRDRDRERDRERERERDRDRDRDTDRRGGDRYDSRYDSRNDRTRDYGRPADRARDSRGDTRGERGTSGGSASVARQATEPLPPPSSSQQQQQQQQQPQHSQQQLQRRGASSVGGGAAPDGRVAAAANGGGGAPRRSGADAHLESESAGSVYPHKRPHRDTAGPAKAPGSTSRGGSGSDMDLDDSDNEGPTEKSWPPPVAAASAGGGAPAAVAVAATTALPPQLPRGHPPSVSTTSLAAGGAATAAAPAAPGRRGGSIGFGQRHHARTAKAAAVAAAATGVAATAPTTTATGTHLCSSAHSPASTGGLSPARMGAGRGASPAPAPGASQHNRATSPGGPRSGSAPAATATAGPAGARQLGGGRRALGSQPPSGQSQPQPGQRQPQQHQQKGAAALQGKAERALAKLQQDRGRPPTPGGAAASAAGGRGGAPPPAVSGKPAPGKEGGGGGGGSGAPASSSGFGGASVLYDADAALDPVGSARVGGDAPLSANMEPDLLGYMSLSMIQFSCAYMVESPRSLFNKAHIKALADEGRTLRRKADSNREANGNRWSALLLTLYLQSALKSMESAYGYEQAGQERDAGLRTSLELLSSASQMLAVVSHEANRLTQQLPRQQPHAAAGGAGAAAPAGGGSAAAVGADGGAASRATPPPPGKTAPAGGGGGGAPATPPPSKGPPGSPTNSVRSLGMQTPSGHGIGGGGGSRTPQHGGGGTPLGPLAAAVACANVGGPAPPPELFVLEAIRLLALKLTAICRTRWCLINQDSLGAALKLHEPTPAHGGGPAAPGGGGGGDDGGGGAGGGGGGRRTSPAAAADSASSTLEAAAITASSYTASLQNMAESVQAYAAAADAWRRAASEARAFNQAVSAAGVEQAAVVAAARIGALGYEGGLWDLMGSVNLARKALDSITGML